MQVTKRSLQRKILFWTVLPLLALWLAGAAVIYQVSLHFNNENNDANLSRIANVLAQEIRTSSTTLSGNTLPALKSATQLLLKTMPEGQVRLAARSEDGFIVIGQPLEPFAIDQISSSPQNTLRTLQRDQQAYRLLTIYLPPNPAKNQGAIWVEASKSLNGQTHSVHEHMYRMALPLIAMLLAIGVLIWFGVKNSLRPLLALKQMVETRQAQDLSPLSLDNAPEEIDALANALNQLLSSTEESINRQRRFIADAAHQLRTPLAGLKSQTELAMRENSPEGLRDRLNMVHTSATRSIHLVNQLLTLARSEPGSINGIPKVKMDLARLVRDLTSELVPRALAARIDLGCDCMVQEAWLEGNSALLRELFINLVENAIKYIPRDGSVTVRLTENATQYIVDVEDNGAGIPDADKQRVFERFFRREQTGNGCGLGMAIVREIVERHSGTVELLDAVPHGLIVHVVLPKNLINT
jgi:two-component system sensor histidine kinase TctE